MTAIGQHAAPASTSAADARGNQMSPVVIAEVALTLLTLAAIGGFARLYRDASFFPPLAVLAVVGHGLAAACRRWRLQPRFVAVIASLSGLVLTVWLFFGDTTVFGIPTPTTVEAADAAFQHAWGRFGVVVAPAPVLPGFQMVAALAVWAGIWFADWSAFRLWASAESVAPAAVLFVFGSMLGAPQHRVWTTVLFAAAALGFMLVHRIARQEGSGTWVAAAPGSGRRSLARAGLGVGAVALIGGAAIGPLVPGAGDDAVLSWRDGTGLNTSRITVSPLVDIRKRLVERSDEEAFTVRSDHPAYWRLTSLDSFDGQIWSSGGSFAQATGDLPHNDDVDIRGARRIRQEITIEGLHQIWAPAAFEMARVEPGDSRMRWDAESATLIVDDDRNTSDGVNYVITSLAPRFTDTRLDRAGGEVPRKIQRYRELPEDFSDEAKRLAAQETRGASSPFRKALALQNWFRRNFEYSLRVPAGHSDDAIRDFLDSRQGYCEQFAGTYAAMARSIGLPSRVAVGFTQGDVDDPNDPELYRVRGKHAHAWPEVWFEDVGWVPFEPTPGRGAPDAESYTGVPAQQATTPTARGPETTVAGSTPSTTAPEAEPELDPGQFNVDAGAGPESAGDGGKRAIDNPFVLAVFALLFIGIVYALLTLGVPRIRRRRARARAVTPADRVALAWHETSETVARGGSTLPFSSETHHEYASRVAPMLGPTADAHEELATLASASAWSGNGPGEESVDRAESLSRDIEVEINRRRTNRARVLDHLDPHRLVTARFVITAPERKTKPTRPANDR